MSSYSGTFAGYPISLINAEFSFLSESSYFVSPANALTKSTYLGVRFRFDKGGTVHFQERTFRRLPADISSFCSLLTALCALDRCTSCNLNPLTPIFWYPKIKLVTFIHDSIVTKNLRDVTLQSYPNPHCFYNLHLKDVRTCSVQVIACIVLVVAKLSYSTIEHRLRLASSAWKVYSRESLYHVSWEFTSSFYIALGTQTKNHDAAYTPQAYYGNIIL